MVQTRPLGRISIVILLGIRAGEHGIGGKILTVVCHPPAEACAEHVLLNDRLEPVPRLRVGQVHLGGREGRDGDEVVGAVGFFYAVSSVPGFLVQLPFDGQERIDVTEKSNSRAPQLFGELRQVRISLLVKLPIPEQLAAKRRYSSPDPILHPDRTHRNPRVLCFAHLSADNLTPALEPEPAGTAFAKEIPLIKGADPADERYVLGVVLEPETVDAQGDIYSPEEVRQAAHRFMEEFGGLGLMHRMRVNGQVKVLESYLAPVDFTVGETTVRKGTWLLAVRILSDELWAEVKDGKLTGFSIGGSARRVPEAEQQREAA